MVASGFLSVNINMWSMSQTVKADTVDPWWGQSFLIQAFKINALDGLKISKLA